MWPVLIRELRVAGRNLWNNWYRVMAAGAVLLIGLCTELFDTRSDGRQLFTMIHQVLFCIIWIFVPLATADCISKERREGTLGLLFLTPLRASEVVVAKCLAQAGRAASMWLAAVPVLTLAFLMGGITKWEVALSVLIHFSSLFCALAAGIAVSSYFTEWSRVMVAAIFASALVLVVYVLAQSWVASFSGGPFADGFRFLLDWDRGNPSLYPKWVAWMLLPCALSIALLVSVVTLTGLIVSRRINTESSTPSRFASFSAKIIFPALYRSWSRKRLLENPVGWLEQRTWTARALQWGWVAIMIAVYSVIAARLDDWLYELAEIHRVLGWGLLAALGLTAAGSLRRERENGMLSLLLITPLTPDKIVLGRIKGLWGQIRWATALFVGGWIYLQGFSRGYSDYFWMLFFTVSYLTLPVTALFCSLWRKSYFAAVLWTLFLGLMYPFALGLLWSMIVLLLVRPQSFWPTFLIVAALVQIWVAWIRGRELIRKLERRSFAF
jgi:ABC-type transport system involved in multi-copper enzyme maturation permease subunit